MTVTSYVVPQSRSTYVYDLLMKIVYTGVFNDAEFRL